MYQVLARKWRPQSFDTLIGQPHIARTLRNAIESDRLAHAYIFSGLRGTGKTSVARILAKCLNCESGPTPEPCNRCAPCSEITSSRSIDVLEVDAASRTKVDQTRELLETLSYAPVRDRFKVLIIDEAHMLSAASFNALLKTLEEPPPRVTFILATTVLQKILPTIRSRCQVLEFRRVGPPELAAHLRSVCDGEEIKISDESLMKIARAGDGSIRDSLSVLERVIAFAGTDVPDQDVLQALGSVGTETLLAMVEGIASRDAAVMLKVLDGVTNEGRDLLHFWSELTGAFRDLQIIRAVPGNHALLSRSPDEAKSLESRAAGLTAEDLSRIFQILAELEPGLKTSSQQRYLFESALIRLASLGAVRPIEEVLASLRGGSGPASGEGGPAPTGGSGPACRPEGGKSSSGGTNTGARRMPVTDVAGSTGPDRRKEFETAVRNANGLLGSVVSRASSIRLEEDDLVFVFPRGSEPFKRQVENPEYRKAILECALEVFGRQLGLRLIVSDDGPEVEDRRQSHTIPEGGGAQENSSSGRSGRSDGRDLMAIARSQPGIKKLMHELGAQIMHVRPMETPPTLPGGTDDKATMEETT